MIGGPIHLVGAGGAGLSALGHLLLDRGAAVSGTDIHSGAALTGLRARGATIAVGAHERGRLPQGVRTVVRSRAVPIDVPELGEARRRGLEILTLSEAISRTSAGRRLLAVAGTHGKTTTAALLVAALARAERRPNWVIGAEGRDGRRAGGWGGGDWLVAEACEYESAFLDLSPEVAVLLNTSPDHLDCFADEEGVLAAFARFAASARGFVVAPQEVALRLGRGPRWLTVGGPGADVHVHFEGPERTAARFGLRGAVKLRDARVPLAGRRLAWNAALAATALLALGEPPWVVRGTLETFRGVRGRVEPIPLRGASARSYLDYAHHPEELEALHEALSARHPDARIGIVFEPHQVRRLEDHAEAFARALAMFDRVAVIDVFCAREPHGPERAHLEAQRLARRTAALGGEAYAAGPVSVAPAAARRMARAGIEVVVLCGAGRIQEVARESLDVSLPDPNERAARRADPLPHGRRSGLARRAAHPGGDGGGDPDA